MIKNWIFINIAFGLDIYPNHQIISNMLFMMIMVPLMREYFWQESKVQSDFTQNFLSWKTVFPLNFIKIVDQYVISPDNPYFVNLILFGQVYFLTIN